ncbi:farnesol dehydrogenase [Pontibacter lucknowensis]|uniref:Farnesol dehydrogenase n=2 Tax=Pontibacter lucknowensis TaxID=1077936 RepID=A0A1N6WZX1_9BACT|nr:farnesol dehydrogenase [Pontibacter lucknowensis]
MYTPTMEVFVTGATGYIGYSLVKELIKRNDRVSALVRSKEKAADLAAMGVKLYVGDLQNVQLLEQAMAGASVVFHLAAYAKPWAKDERTYRQVNVTGTDHVLTAALKNNVQKVILTSTASVYGPAPSPQHPVDENTRRTIPYTNSYESSKAEAEVLARSYVKQGLAVVILSPTRVYGPGKETDSNGIAKLLRLYLAGKWHFMPGDGNSVGNYCYVDDVVRGHLLAMAQGRSGENYLLGGEDATYQQLFALIARLTGKQRKLIPIPGSLLRGASWVMVKLAKLTGTKPLITPDWTRKLLLHWSVSSHKAERELGYTITPLKEGLSRTLQSLQQK